ncbi:hypothetical protein SAMN06265349_10873 [Flavobacterium resistens]|uniref:Uncharacterized protein n=1 Tax=Flavobacterium resistens TaxID=443612 RepID=A0A521FCH0_9FLAO|nr:hypothetical protein SAMN06265349_10873 [Flavobacterium resistens]
MLLVIHCQYSFIINYFDDQNKVVKFLKSVILVEELAIIAMKVRENQVLSK